MGTFDGLPYLLSQLRLSSLLFLCPRPGPSILSLTPFICGRSPLGPRGLRMTNKKVYRGLEYEPLPSLVRLARSSRLAQKHTQRAVCKPSTFHWPSGPR